MVTLDEAKDIATTRGWLNMTSEAFRRAILARVALQSFQLGESIYSVNDPPGGMYGLVAGSVKVSMAPGDDGPFIGHIMTPGSWSGYGPTIAGCNRIIGLTAGRNCQVLFLPLHAINEILTRDPIGWRYLAGLALIDTQIALGAMEDLMIRDEFRRFLAVLLRSGGYRNGAKDIAKDMQPVWVDVNQTDLANMCNLSRTTTGVFLRRLEAEGQVRIGYGQIGIFAPAALRAKLASDR
ncbi:Crp/Fnr family transcriptional regulator [Rhodoblastus sp.]|uniref:Crp/Fnr family transcriptional regulator n=1 Tax=Rhodoblastus sp. TaxID=1962975 RepID=UPI0035B3CDD5